ncbi:MAG: B12-binding domain-containing protein [Chloroflexi bacterium]|nr:B12-binding domain-containing protein [Chloroflexota bacterium]
MTVSSDLELEEVVRASDRPTYNTAAVEQRTGLRPATFRAWERRYGFPKPRRLPGNQRLYSDQDIAAIRWLQRRTDEGLSISHAIRLLQERLREGLIPTQPPADGPAGRPPAALAEDLGRTLIAFDSNSAERILNEAFAMYRVEDVCMDVIAPMLVEVGERWHRGEVSVATEHFATSFARRKLFSLINAYETGYGRSLIFTACAPEEWHEVGALMVSLFLVRHGFRLRYLGPNLATDGLGETLRAQQPDLLIVSATSYEAADRVLELDAVLTSLPEPRPVLAYGGHGFDDERRRHLVHGVYLGEDARAAVQIVERLLGASTNGAARH